MLCAARSSVCSQRLCLGYRSSAYPPNPSEACPAAATMIEPAAMLLVPCSFVYGDHYLYPRRPRPNSTRFSHQVDRVLSIIPLLFLTHTCLASLGPFLDTPSPSQPVAIIYPHPQRHTRHIFLNLFLFNRHSLALGQLLAPSLVLSLSLSFSPSTSTHLRRPIRSNP